MQVYTFIAAIAIKKQFLTSKYVKELSLITFMRSIGEDGWREGRHGAAGGPPSAAGMSQVHNGLHFLLVQLPI